MDIIIIFTLLTIGCFIVAYIAHTKGKSGVGFFFLSFFISPIFSAIILFINDKPAMSDNSNINFFRDDISDDNKYILFATLAIALFSTDGEISSKEGFELGRYLSSVPGMNPEREKKIVLTAKNKGLEIIQSANSLSVKDREELINFLISMATADGYFHGREAAFIIQSSILMGHTKEQVKELNYRIFTDYKIDLDEFKNGFQKMSNSKIKMNFFKPEVKWNRSERNY
tara:strand:+ start:1244 stop:1927 length:684 start_codon:yes stop_codon:yes gene_type:complete